MKSLYQKALKVLEISLGEAHSWAVKLFMAYRYGRPKEIKDTHLFAEQPLLYPLRIEVKGLSTTMNYSHCCA